MGFFNRSEDKQPAPTPSAPVPDKAVVAGGVMPQLAAAREKLKAKDLAAALAIYETLLGGAGERSDVLMTISADLGTHGHIQEIIELLAPRYDVEKHGAPAGFNLLQAYLVTRNAEAAQHLLDLLFALQRPDLEARLIGFSNAVSELFISENEAVQAAGPEPGHEEVKKVSLVSISKPVWFYGLEELAPHLLPRQEGKLRRVAFAQCALPGLENIAAYSDRPEDDIGRLSRGLALWLADTFTASAGYAPVAAIGTMGDRYANFPMEWSAENLRQLNDSSDSGLDYVIAGALRNRNDDFELILRIWEVKKFRELKVFTTRWTPATADAELLKLREQLCAYMEWAALPAANGLAYAAPAAPLAYALGLGTALSLFLGEKGLLTAAHLPADLSGLLSAARRNPDDTRAQLALITALLRQKQQGVAWDPETYRHASEWLATPAAQAADVSALAVKLG